MKQNLILLVGGGNGKLSNNLGEFSFCVCVFLGWEWGLCKKSQLTPRGLVQHHPSVTALTQKRANYSQQDPRDHGSCLSCHPGVPSHMVGGSSCYDGRLPGFSLALSFLLRADERDVRFSLATV